MESLQIIHLFMLAYRKATFEQLMEMMTKYNNQNNINYITYDLTKF